MKDKSQYFSGLGKGRKEGRRRVLEKVLSWYEELDLEDWDTVACVIQERLKKELEWMKNESKNSKQNSEGKQPESSG